MDPIEKNGVAINPASLIHYTDHLAVISKVMGIPLLFIDEEDYEIGTKYYPDIEAELIDYQIFNPEYLISHYDVLFSSDLWDRRVFREKYRALEEKYDKRLRNVHCPHGFSDKGFYLEKCAQEDITLIYGQNMLDQMESRGVLKDLQSYVISGNYRYTYYKQHKAFLDGIAKEEVLNQFKQKAFTLLYAPTWMDLEVSSTFFESHEAIFANLPDSINLIVKLHPRLELDDTPNYYQILGKYEEKPNVVFIKNFPLVYPLLAHSDAYLGDMSSVGYDFLAFNRPMFFLNKQKRDPQTDRGLYLFRCGTEILPDGYSSLYSIIEKAIPNDQENFGKIREEVYRYTFGEEKPFDQLKKEIIAAYQ